MINELLAQIEGDEKKLKENARPKLKEPIISREAAKSLGVFCLNEFLYDKCRFGDNCRFGHGLMADIKACKKCCKFVLMDNCKFGDKCNLAHNCDCIDKFAARIKEAAQKKALHAATASQKVRPTQQGLTCLMLRATKHEASQ